MTLKQAFPIGPVRMAADPLMRTVNHYQISLNEEPMLIIEAERLSLQHAVPKRGERVYLDARRPDAMYSVEGKITSVQDGEVVSISINVVSKVQRMQRRKDFRVDMHMAMSATPEFSDNPVAVETLDLSAGGARIHGPVPWSEGTRLNLEFHLESGAIQCLASVTRGRQLRNGRFEHGVRFLNLLAGEQDRIARVLMKRLREQLRGEGAE